MSGATLLATFGPLSYYHIPGTASTPINIDPSVTAKAILVAASTEPGVGAASGSEYGDSKSGGNAGGVTQLSLTDNSFYMVNDSGNLSLFNKNSQLATATAGSGNRGGLTHTIQNPASPGQRGQGTLGGRGGDNTSVDAEAGRGYGHGRGGYGRRYGPESYSGGGGGGGGFDLQSYANFAGYNLNSQASTNASLLLAISPGMPPSTAEVSIAGVSLAPTSTQNGKNYYIIKTSGRARFNTTRPKTLYYVGAGEQGRSGSLGGIGYKGGLTMYQYAGIRILGGMFGFNQSTEYSRNSYIDALTSIGRGTAGPRVIYGIPGHVDLNGGGGGGAGGLGGASGGAGKIELTSNYLNWTITSSDTSVYTEDKYLGGAVSPVVPNLTASQNGGNAAQIPVRNNPYTIGGGDGAAPQVFVSQRIPAGVLDSYTGTTIFQGREGFAGTRGGNGQAQGFSVLHSAADGQIVPTQDLSRVAQPGAYSVNAGAVGTPGVNLFQTTLYGGDIQIKQLLYENSANTNGTNGAAGVNGRGFGAGGGGGGGRAGAGVIETWHYSDDQLVNNDGDGEFRGYDGAAGGGGGGGGNGAPGFSLDAAERTTGLDAFGDTNGCVIIVVG
jgi:hypothetical protein